MKRTFIAICVLLACVLTQGCGDSAYTLSKEEAAAFNGATPEVKQLWEQARKADQANDYLAAGNSYRSLLAKGITPEQMAAVQTALGGLNIRLNEAATKGDAAAQKALEAAKESAPRR
jgi:hypothetical protein